MSRGASIPISDIATIETELMLADLESLERRIVQMEKKAKGGDTESKELHDLAVAQPRRIA
jgi:ribosome-binding ATPase YchF (GTP1/OBG family)